MFFCLSVSANFYADLLADIQYNTVDSLTFCKRKYIRTKGEERERGENSNLHFAVVNPSFSPSMLFTLMSCPKNFNKGNFHSNVFQLSM